MDYKDQIKSPKWQKRRLEILSRDNFTCQACGATEETLHVHHIHYIKNKDIWDYPDNLLITLCEECHEAEHLAKNDWVRDIISDINGLGITYGEIEGILTHIYHELENLKTINDIFKDKNISFYIIGDMERIAIWRKSLKK